MLSNLNTIPSGSASNILFDFLVGLEAPERTIYLDNATPMRATIGVGFNLTGATVLDTVLVKGFGFNLSSSQTDKDDLNKLYDIFTNPTFSASTMQTKADAIMSGRNQGSFTFAGGATGVAQMRAVFDVLAPDYAQAAINRLSAFGASGFSTSNWSWELVALTSLAYNGGPGIIGQGLATAI